jgi:hypothetical protein
MMPTFPSLPLKFRRAGFPRYGFKAGLSDGAFPAARGLRVESVCLRPSCPSLASSFSPFCAGGRDALEHLRARGGAVLPQGPSLRSRFCCPSPSSLNRPHPPPSQAHPDFAAWRFIRDAFAVRHRLGDPRVVPCFRRLFSIGMSPPETPGSSSAACTQFLRG